MNLDKHLPVFSFMAFNWGSVDTIPLCKGMPSLSSGEITDFISIPQHWGQPGVSSSPLGTELWTILGTGSFLVKSEWDNKFHKSEEKTHSKAYSRIDFLADPTTEAEQSWLTEWGLHSTVQYFLAFFTFLFCIIFFYIFQDKTETLNVLGREDLFCLSTWHGSVLKVCTVRRLVVVNSSLKGQLQEFSLQLNL